MPLSIYHPSSKLMLGDSDFLVFYTTGKIANKVGFNSIYNQTLMGTQELLYRQDVKPFLNLPVVAVPFIIFSSIPYKIANSLFMLLNATLIIWCIFQLKNLFGLNEKRTLLLFAFPPVLLVIALGQLSGVLLFALILFYKLYKQEKYFWAGTILGILLIKYQYLALYPLVIVFFKHRFRLTGGIVATTTLLIGSSLALYGKNLFAQLYMLYGLFEEGYWNITRIYGISLMSLNQFLPSIYLTYGISALIFIFTAYYLYKNQSKLSIEQALLISVVCAMLVAPYSFIYDLLLLLPFIAWYISIRGTKDKIMLFMLYGTIFLFQLLGLAWVSTLILIGCTLWMVKKSTSLSV